MTSTHSFKSIHMKRTFIVLISFAFLISCKVNEKNNTSDNPFYGEKFKTSKSISYESLLADIGSSDDAINNIVVEGDVSGVCQAMGCWMTMVSSKDTDSPEMFIKFKDYGFFVPKDLTGGRVIMKGNAFKEETSVEELRHYAEDEGLSKEEIAAIKEPVVELKFMASGVQIIK